VIIALMSAFRPFVLAAVLLSLSAHAEGPGLPPVGAPLGHIGEVVEPVPSRGLPGGETVTVARFPGCEREQAIHVSRFLHLGAAGAAETLQAYLDGNPNVARWLFGKERPLARAIDRARGGRFTEGRACRPKGGAFLDVGVAQDGKLTLTSAPPLLCTLERGPSGQGGTWWFTDRSSKRIRARDLSGVVGLAPAPDGASDRCRPRLTAALFDDTGTVRFRYHADYGGEVRAEVIGRSCRTLELRFDPGTQRFNPRKIVGKGCRP